ERETVHAVALGVGSQRAQLACKLTAQPGKLRGFGKDAAMGLSGTWNSSRQSARAIRAAVESLETRRLLYSIIDANFAPQPAFATAPKVSARGIVNVP